GDGRVQLVDRVQRPQAQIGGDLVVARAARVELTGQGADFGVQQSLDERMHVFVRCADRGAVGQFVGDAVEAVEQLRFFAGAQNAGAAERVPPRLAREDILGPEAVIDGKGAV